MSNKVEAISSKLLSNRAPRKKFCRRLLSFGLKSGNREFDEDSGDELQFARMNSNYAQHEEVRFWLCDIICM